MMNGGEQADGPSRYRQRLSSFRKLFQRSSFDRSKVQESDRNSPMGGDNISDSPGSARDPEELEDHMHGSMYHRADICQACRFPRESSVYCPITRRHHGTDELMGYGGNDAGGEYMYYAPKHVPLKQPSKTPVLRCHPNQSRRGNCNSATTIAEDQPPPLTSVSEDATAEGVDDCSAEVNVSLDGAVGCLGQEGSKNGTTSAQHNGRAVIKAGDRGDGAVPHESDHTQYYYCYTDEQGDTYYYTEDQQDPKQQPPSVTHTVSAHTGTEEVELSQHEDPKDEADAEGVVPPGAYVCECIDENGETVYYVYTPEVDDADEHADTAQLEATAINGRGVSAASAVLVAKSDATSEDANDATPASKRKKPGKFLAAIASVFKIHHKGHTRGKHVDAAAETWSIAPPASPSADMDARPASLMSTVVSDTAFTGDQSEVNEYDKEVRDFMDLLDEAEKKRFMKERKRFIKELVLSERKERGTIMKYRHDGVETIEREMRANEIAVRRDNSVKKGWGLWRKI